MGNKPEKAIVAGHQYTRCRILGKGSFGKVYAMQHSRDSSVVRVIKEMSKAQIVDKGETVTQLVLKERELLTSLVGCPFVVRIWATTQDEKHLYMMLDFCSGGELEYQLQAQPGRKIKEDWARFFCAEMTVALEHAHNRCHIVHRDLKPENVLLDAQGHIAIIDFNIAERCDEHLQIPNPKGHHVGTLPYIAPELLGGLDHSAAVDWWSLGIMLFEMTHGHVLFKHTEKDSKSPSASQLKFIRANRPNLSAVVHGSPEFLELLGGLLALEPSERWNAKKIKNCAWMKGIDWKIVKKKGLKPPLIPNSEKVNFHQDLQMEESLGMSKVKDRALTAEEQKKFESWDWADPNQELSADLLYVDKKKSKGTKLAKKTRTSSQSKSLSAPSSTKATPDDSPNTSYQDPKN